MSLWHFRRNFNNRKNDENSNSSYSTDEQQSAWNSNKSSSLPHINKRYFAQSQSQSNSSNPFESKPQIGRTPIVLDTNINRTNYKKVSQSPAMRYFIPNTPKGRGYSEMQESFEMIEAEPGSTGIACKRDRRRRKSSNTLAQPEGTYSPIPKSKILSELNQSIQYAKSQQSQQSQHQSPVSLSSSLSSSALSLSSSSTSASSELFSPSIEKIEASDNIRNEIRAVIEEMDYEISKELNDKYNDKHLLSHSPAMLSRPPATNDNDKYTNPNLAQDTDPTDMKIINNEPLIHQANQSKPDNIEKKKKTHCCSVNVKRSVDILWNTLHFIWIIFILGLYCNIIDFQWK